MKRTLFVTTLSLFLAAGSAFPAEQTWAGQVSDSMCGKDHSMMHHGGKKMSARDCTLACVKGGSKYVFVSKGVVYEIENQEMKDLQVHAGHNVRLTGELASAGKSIRVSKITMPAAKK